MQSQPLKAPPGANPPGPAGCDARARKDGGRKVGGGRIVMGNYLCAVWGCRYFWLSLVRMDLRTRYRGSVLGIGWSLLQPVAMTIILCTVFHTIWQTPVRDYSLFLMSGLTVWHFVST